MHKIQSVRHGWEKMTPGFGSQRQSQATPPDVLAPPPQTAAVVGNPPPLKAPRPDLVPCARPPMQQQQQQHLQQQQQQQRHSPLSLSFNVPFSSNLAGPDPDDVVHATPGAFQRWTHPSGTPEGTPVHKLPVHAGNVENLRLMCKLITDDSGGRLSATITSSEPRPIPGLQRGPLKALVTNVVVSGEADLVRRVRSKILIETPLALKCATVDVDEHHIMDGSGQGLKSAVLEHMNYVANWTGTDVFLLRSRASELDTASTNGVPDLVTDHRLRLAVYGDVESAEHAKTRMLIMIDQILKRKVDIYRLELSMHTMICGRLRKHVKQIESSTNTAIYFPPPFPEIFGYTPPNATRRRADEIFITGLSDQDIYRAKAKLHEVVRTTSVCVKEVMVSPDKIDGIILERHDKIRKITDYNGSYILFPPLGVQRGAVRVQGTGMLHVERTVRELMAISGQFYAASWWLTLPDATQRVPTASDVSRMLADICISPGADISFENLTFHISGSDDSVKAALYIIDSLPFVRKAQSHLKIKIELANEHKEFVSGKKNGKINKIMSQSRVNVYFDLFNEYNFFIDVSGASYECAKNGLDLVEQEMPASIAFHVPDQYHKRIIGIGGQHIQRIMKKYSVFVKFSNAMDRGGSARDEDDMKVDNVICRTPARNAQNLDLVKQEIMDMVEKSDAEFVAEQVGINRFDQRTLLARMPVIEELEKKWNCKLTFPSTEEASDVVTITGPEWQLPKAIDELLGMITESHEITMTTTEELASYFVTPDFQRDVVDKLRSSYEVDLHVNGLSSAAAAEESLATGAETLTLGYTRNNAGGLKDAIDFLTAQLVAHGLDASTVRGAIPRPKSDSFEDSLPFFDSKLLQRADPAAGTDSPTRSLFNEGAGGERSFFDKLRKPGSLTSLSSFLDRRKNGSGSQTYMRHASANASKVSLASLESQSSSYRNPWNDSGVNLADEDSSHGWPTRFSNASADSKFPLGSHISASTSQLSLSSTPLPPPGSLAATIGFPGDSLHKHDRGSHDSGRPGTAHSTSSHLHGPIGPPSPAK